jgi:hypothetical protein
MGMPAVMVPSRSPAGAQALVQHAHSLGMQAQWLADPNTVVGDCGWAGWDLTAVCCAVAGLSA